MSERQVRRRIEAEHADLKNVAISVLGRGDSHHHVHFDGGHIKFISVATLTAMMRGASGRT